MKVVAEVGINHGGTIEKFKHTIKMAKWSGADAIKIQTYIPSSLTINCRNVYFRYRGRYLWDIYNDAHIPRDWHHEIFKMSEKDQPIFSTPFSEQDVDFLEMNFSPPCYKVASFEANNLDFVEYIAKLKKPMVVSLGCVHEKQEIDSILNTIAKHQDVSQTTLLHCVSQYPCSISGANLWRIPALKKLYPFVTIGFSDHTLSGVTSVVAVSVGAEYIEKHFYHFSSSADKHFSLHTKRFSQMICDIKEIVKGLEMSVESAIDGKNLERSVFVVQDVKRGEVFTEENVKIIRPGMGLHPSYYKTILGCVSEEDVQRGTPFMGRFIGQHVL